LEDDALGDPGQSQPDVFLSYAREDEARARELATALGQRGFSVFWDREVPPGQTWHSYIGEALANAKCVVVAWSSHSVASQWVIEEASEGKDRNVLVPILFETVLPPLGFRAIQAASLIDWRPGRRSAAFEGLLGAIQRIIGGQAGSGTAAKVELSAPSHPVSSQPAPKLKPFVRPTTPSLASSEPRAKPVRPQASAWSHRTVLATLVAFVAMAGAGGAAVYWWRTQPEPTPPSSMTEAETSTPAPGSPDPAAEAEAVVEPPSLAPSETAGPREEMRDCPECPDMVLVPAGEFLMGSPPGQPGRDNNEGPQHKVTIMEPLWVGKDEVTFAQWDACVAAGGCNNKSDDAGWGRGSRPVINVSWNDANEYVDWLSKKTGEKYRLLSEAEWEYVARAGTTTAYWWGDEVGRGNANCDGCGSKWDNTKTAPVGSFGANDFGLYDTAGNVWEWVEDCWNNSYSGAPTDGSPWLQGSCSRRILRGGSWYIVPWRVRSANRGRNIPDYRLPDFGFRVARAPS
jgi:formylglycine-generating enzyme required for sulfatase activity